MWASAPAAVLKGHGFIAAEKLSSLKGHGFTAREKTRFCIRARPSVVPYSSQIELGFSPCGCFERARLQPCRNHSKMNPALAAEGRFFASVDFLRAAVP